VVKKDFSIKVDLKDTNYTINPTEHEKKMKLVIKEQ